VLRRERFFFLRGGWLFAVGESWDGKEEGEIREGRQSGHILTFADGITDGLLISMIPSAILTVNRSRHYTKIPVWIPRWFHLQFWRWIDHVTIRSCRFESLGDSVNKITRKNFHVSKLFFFLILNFPSVIPSVYTDWSSPPIYTDEITNKKYVVGNYDRKLPTELFHQQCRWY